MKTNTKKSDIKVKQVQKIEKVFIFFSFILVVFSVIALTYSAKQKNSLKKNLKYTEGIIYDLSIGTKRSWKLYYNYFINGNKYQGNGHWYPNTDTLSLGDTIKIVYDTTNISFSRPARDVW